MADQKVAERFRGSVALVTGGSKGIGRAIAMRLASEGAAVAVTWFRDRAAGEKTLAELEERGARAFGTKAFLGDPDVPARLLEEVRSGLGEPDLLVSGAATGVQRPVLEIEKTHWDWTMETNAAAFLRLIGSAPNLKAILALTSLGSQRVLPGYGMVGASKAALESLVRYLAVELAPKVRVNAISAGVVDTDSLRRFPNALELLDKSQRDTPLGRLVTPDDVAGLAAFLLSEDAQMITGQTVVIDGGYSVKA
jgi:enoyl-[acyl-carrier protein] reductase III